MIRDNLNPTWKAILTRTGDARVFGEDSDVRREMSEAQLLKRFDEVWKNTLEPGVRAAEEISQKKATDSLEPGQRQWAPISHQYRQFSIQGAVFIARLNKDAKADGMCDQLWSIGMHRDTTRLSIYFRTVAEKEFFDRLATNLNYEQPRYLALSLVMDFLRKFPEFEAVAKEADAKGQ